MEKDQLSIQKVVKNQKNKHQNLKLWARVPIALRSCPDSSHMYR